MIPSRWRQPEAPRPSRASSRGTAALLCAAVRLHFAPTALHAGATSLLEPGDRALCTAFPGPRVVTGLHPDGGTTTVPALLTIVLDPRHADIGRGKGEELYSPAADVDGRVDGTDLAILAARFGDSL
jgi:hypothetical protein